MKLLMIIVDSGHKEELEVLLKRQNVTGYTEIPNAHGVGETGIRMGSRAHPRTSSIFFTVLESEQVDSLREDIAGYCESCGEHMKMVVWGVEQII